MTTFSGKIATAATLTATNSLTADATNVTRLAVTSSATLDLAGHDLTNYGQINITGSSLTVNGAAGFDGITASGSFNIFGF